MKDSSPVIITVSRVIPAPKWRVIRLLTKVEDFPSYIPSIKASRVLEKVHHTMKTEWHIEVEKVPIRWIEEDRISLQDSTMRFKALEGDLQEFSGVWKFDQHRDGTHVTVTVQLQINIPAIKEFAEARLKVLLQKNFEAILEAVERRLISSRYRGYKNGEVSKIAGFGLLGHFYNYGHLERCLTMLRPDLKMPSREFVGQLFHAMPPFKMHDIIDFTSKTGEKVNGCAIVATFIPDMIEKDIWGIFSKVVKACKIAEKHGVGIVALGGFTSIIGERINRQVAEHVDVAVTTGNTFTAAMALDGVFKAAELLGKDIASCKLAIIGGTGDIGSGCARVLVDRVAELTITGRTVDNLKRLNAELTRKRKARIKVTRDNHAAVKNADIIIAVAASATPLLSVEWFKPGAIVCDVGYPKNISHAQTTREDILIFSGGLAKSPTAVSFPIDVGLPSADTLYGCFSEAVILSLEHRFENYSFGRGNIIPERIDEIRAMGAKHGFEISDFYWGDKLVGDHLLQKIRSAAT